MPITATPATGHETSPETHAHQAVPQTVLTGQLSADMSFAEKVWAVTCRVPAGWVATYGDVAKAIGQPQASRAVGRALGQNPFAPTVPCHRVVSGQGKLTGYSGEGGVCKKQTMLADEGVAFRGSSNAATDNNPQRVDLAAHRMPLADLQQAQTGATV